MSLKKASIRISVVLIIAYLVLLIPESDPVLPDFPQKHPFIWNLDSLWYSLEDQFQQIKNSGSSFQINEYLDEINRRLVELQSEPVSAASEKFSELENQFFMAAPYVGAYPEFAAEYLRLYAQMRFIVKDQSLAWDMNNSQSRNVLYRLLYGGRAAVEEILLQHKDLSVLPESMGYPEPSSTPRTDILGVAVHSGDILVSRGGAPTSALIARGNDYPGNFSHIALVYVDEKNHLVSIIESHIERGVTISSLEDYLGDKKLRVMVLRLRSDLPMIQTNPLLPHKAASIALKEASNRHIPYDFEMNIKDPSKQFCSEVAFVPYNKLGIKFWRGVSNISSIGVVRWLSYFGVKYFVTHEPSDLEYDPQLRVVAEWRDPETLYRDHVDNAVIEAMIECANQGKDLEYPFYLLPAARVLKVYSLILNVFGSEGPVPEGMSPASGLRNKQLSEDHERIRKIVELKALKFRQTQHYTPPYWQLVRFAGEAVKETGY